MAANHTYLISAKQTKSDEFYTQLLDIKKNSLITIQHFVGKLSFVTAMILRNQTSANTFT